MNPSKKEIHENLEQIEHDIKMQMDTFSSKSADTAFRILEDDFVMDSGQNYSRLMEQFNSPHINKQRLLLTIHFVDKLLSSLDSKYTYHNKQHTVDQVARNALMLANLNDKPFAGRKTIGRTVTDTEKEILALITLGHDLGFLTRYDDNEKIGCIYMRKCMERAGYDEATIVRVEGGIMATKFSTEHKQFNDFLYDLACDADFSHLADPTPDFVSKVEGLYQEQKACGKISKTTTFAERLKQEPKFFEWHTYRTDIAKFRYGDRELFANEKDYLEKSGKGRNIVWVNNKLEEFKSTKLKKKNKK